MTPPDSYQLVLDSGTLMGSFSTSLEARIRATMLNAESAAGRARGDMVTLRRIVGVVHVKPKPLRPISPPPRKRRKLRAQPVEA